jgi:hypothetical protein
VKTIGIFGLVVTASIALLQPAQGRPQASGRSSSPAHHFSASAGHYSGGPRRFSGGGARYYGASPRFSSQAALRNRVYSPAGQRFAVNRTTALTPRVYSASRQRVASNRVASLRARGFDNQGRVLSQASRSWDRGRDHFWHGHRCHWRNNAWVIIDPWLYYPWGYGYGYYPYSEYSYYDDGYYDDGYAPAEYSQPEYDSGNSSVGQVQAALARKGYYHGAIDGSMGPETRSALRQYQRNHGLNVTGGIDGSVLEALKLR